MFESAEVMALYAETPLHPGSGASTGPIDLPVQRERHTGLPLIQATSIKGVLRDIVKRRNPKADIDAIFGPDVNNDAHSGALSPTDARLLLLPLRSLEDIFVWATCPFIVQRLQRDLGLARKPVKLPSLSVSAGEALTATGCTLSGPLVLEDEDFALAPKSKDVDTLVTEIRRLIPTAPGYNEFANRLETHLVVLADSDFRRLVEKGTDVVTRIKLNDKKTTTGGGGNMWIEELLPSDCLFYTLLLAMNSRKPGSQLTHTSVLGDVKSATDGEILQVGGNETVGRGWMRARWMA